MPVKDGAADTNTHQEHTATETGFGLGRYWPWAAIALATGIGAMIAYGIFGVERPLPLKVETATLAPVTRILAVNGRMTARHPVEVRSLITGKLKQLLVSEGDLVTANQVLAEVDRAASQAVVGQAKAARDTAAAVLREATDAHDRAASLGTNIARAELESREYAVESAASELARKAAILEQASADLETHTIRAPITGRVISLDIESGQVVGPSLPLLTLADLGNLIVEADVDEIYATEITDGQPVFLQLAGATETRAGKVSFVSTRVDIASGGLAIEIEFDQAIVAPVGLTVTINIIVEQREAAFTVPRTALVADDGGRGIFLLRDGVATRQAVTVIDWPADRLIVRDGVAEGDILIVDAEGVSAGQAVSAARP
jgi:membrane fusion protein (multidrug efflux system)